MKILALIVLAISFSSFAATPGQDAYLLGPPDEWGVRLTPDESGVAVRLGARMQPFVAVTDNSEVTQNDIYLRRLRFQFEMTFSDTLLYYMDIRSDNVNRSDRGEGEFSVGDAFLKYSPKFFEGEFRVFRAKLYVSRTQTVSSSKLLFPYRAPVSDFAANFVSENRRAANAQVTGDLGKFASYQFVIGDGVHSEVFEDTRGASVDEIIAQDFVLGTKLRFYPLPDWKPDRFTETYMGRGKHFSIGAGYFTLQDILFRYDTDKIEVDRELINMDVSFHYGSLALFAEYFIFDGVIGDITAATNPDEIGKSEGWFVQGEYFLENFNNVAPFFRYQNWDTYDDHPEYQQEEQLYGINWYIYSNDFRVGAAYRLTEYGEAIEDYRKEKAYMLFSMLHF